MNYSILLLNISAVFSLSWFIGANLLSFFNNKNLSKFDRTMVSLESQLQLIGHWPPLSQLRMVIIGLHRSIYYYLSIDIDIELNKREERRGGKVPFLALLSLDFDYFHCFFSIRRRREKNNKSHLILSHRSIRSTILVIVRIDKKIFEVTHESCFSPL